MAVTLNASTSSGFVQSADTSGEINLQSNGTTKLTVASTGVSGTLVQGTAVASTSGTSIDFTGIPSWAKNIRVIFNGVSTSGTSNWLVQIGTSGGFVSTGYSSGASSGAASVATTTSTAGFNIRVGGASDTVNGIMTIANINSTNWVSSHSAGGNAFWAGGGNLSLGGTLDRVRITTVNGTDTFDAGTINIIYEG